jgi:hypothetical protein
VELLLRTLRDFRAAFTALTPPEQTEALQCVLKGVTVHPQKLALEIFELEEFRPSLRNLKEWLALEDDSRTPGFTQLSPFELGSIPIIGGGNPLDRSVRLPGLDVPQRATFLECRDSELVKEDPCLAINTFGGCL